VLTIAFLPGCAPEPEKVPTLEDMEPTIWRCQTLQTKGSGGAIYIDTFKEEIEAKTNGKLKVEIYYSSGLGYDETKGISNIRDGLYELTDITGSYVHGEFFISDCTDFWYLIPYNKECQKEVAEALSPQFEEALTTKYNQYFFGMLFGWPFSNMTTDKEVKSLDDMKGLKIRAKGVYMTNLVNSLGGTAAPLPFVEIYDAFSKGTVDAVITCPCAFWYNKFHEMGRYMLNFNTGSSDIFFVVNKDAFDALPVQVQGWVREALKHGIEAERDFMMKDNADCMENLEGAGVKMTDISPQGIERIKEITQPFIDKYIAEGGAPAEQAINTIKTTVAKWEAKQ